MSVMILYDILKNTCTNINTLTCSVRDGTDPIGFKMHIWHMIIGKVKQYVCCFSLYLYTGDGGMYLQIQHGILSFIFVISEMYLRDTLLVFGILCLYVVLIYGTPCARWQHRSAGQFPRCFILVFTSPKISGAILLTSQHGYVIACPVKCERNYSSIPKLLWLHCLSLEMDDFILHTILDVRNVCELKQMLTLIFVKNFG